MHLLVTGSSGHLGEGIMRSLTAAGHSGVGIDIKPGALTDHRISITDRAAVTHALKGCDAILHTATLHKPHVATHSKQDFVDTNILGTLALLELAVEHGIGTLIFTSTTSAFGDTLTPPPGAPAAWIDETAPARPKNIYGVTKTAAEDLCALFARNHGLNVIVLRTSRFFPEEDDSPSARASFGDTNLKANEFLYRRADLADVVSAHFAALDLAADLGFARFIISATPPFDTADLGALRRNAPAVVARYFPQMPAIYAELGFRMADGLDRVDDNAAARAKLGWTPTYDFARILEQLAAAEPIGSPLARTVGSKGYHERKFTDGPYPVA